MWLWTWGGAANLRSTQASDTQATPLTAGDTIRDNTGDRAVDTTGGKGNTSGDTTGTTTGDTVDTPGVTAGDTIGDNTGNTAVDTSGDTAGSSVAGGGPRGAEAGGILGVNTHHFFGLTPPPF